MSNFFNTNQGLGQLNVVQGDLLNANIIDIILGRFADDKFGRNNVLGFNDIIDLNEFVLSPLAPLNGLDITFPLGTTTMQLASTNANDVGVTGTGLRTLRIVGLDIDYQEIVETVTLDGLTPVTTVNEYLRINDLIGLTAGSTTSNEGNISITDIADTFTLGLANTRLYKVMGIGDFLSKTFTFTVPNGQIFAPSRFLFQSNATSTKTVEVKFFRQQLDSGSDGSGFILADKFFIAQGGVEVQVGGNRALRPKTDIKITISRNTGNGNIICHAKLFGVLKRTF